MEQGIEKGMQKGLEQGLEQGIEKGKLKEKIEIAENLLLANVDVKIISQTTGLSIEDIENFQKKSN
jgi:predicted transposase/invertase (TIGR01784 family)